MDDVIVFSKQYGAVDPIWHRTNGKCHLCHQPVELHTYGCVRLYGGQAGSVDHVVTRHHGGTNDFDNLRISHQTCNSRRGIRDVEEVRLELAGRSDEPRSAGQEALRTIAITGSGAALCALVVAATAEPVVDEASRLRVKKRVVGATIFGGFVCFLGALATR